MDELLSLLAKLRTAGRSTGASKVRLVRIKNRAAVQTYSLTALVHALQRQLSWAA